MNTLRWWVTLGVSAIVGLAVFSFAGRYYQVTADWAAHDALSVAQEKTLRFGRWIQATGEPAELRESAAVALTDRSSGTHLAVLDTDGRVLPDLTTPAFPPGDFGVPPGYLTNRAAWLEPHASWVRGPGRTRHAVAWFPLGHRRVWKEGERPRAWSVAVVSGWETESERRLAGLWTSMVTRTLGLAIASGVLTFLLVGLWTRSLAAAADSAEVIARGQFGLQRLEVPRADSELRRLVTAFNALMDRLQRLHAAQEQFVADAAHELRTPLTILRGEIQVALRKERDPERYRAILESNREEVIRLSSLVEGLLTLARVDAGKEGAEPSPFSVESVARQVIEKLRAVGEHRRVSLVIEVPDQGDLAVQGDPQALHRVLLNLVDNAIRYSSPGDAVRVALSADEKGVEIQIRDAGPGIAPEHLPRLFDRFYRVESARDRASGGCGLGLAIAKALTEAGGGRVEAASEVGQGATFTVWWPRRAGNVSG